jgi:hypothetical protein
VSSDPILDAVETAVVAHFGHTPQRASVSFLGVDPIEILRFEPIPGERAYLSLGMSRHPMTSATESVQSTDGPRAELMLHLLDPTDEYADVWRKVALLAASPAVEGVVYTDGMTVEVGEPLAPGSACVGIIVVESPLAPIAAGTDREVRVLQAIPATSTELAWARVRGSAALRERWAERGTDLLDLARRPVALD